MDLAAPPTAPGRAQRSLALPFLLVLAACGGSQPEPETAASIEVPAPPPVPERALETLLPPTAPAVFRVDLAALRRSPYYEVAHDWLARVADEDGREILALADRTDEIWGAAVDDGEGDMEVVLAARGSYTAEDEARIAQSADPPATPGLRAGFTVYYRSREAFARVGDHTIVIGDRASVDLALDLQESGAGTGPTDAAVTAGMERIGFRQAGVAGAMRITEAIYTSLELPPIMYSSLESAAFSVNADTGVHGAALVRTSNALVAMGLVSIARNQLAEVRREPEIEMLGLRPLLDGITLANEGPEAWARLEVAAADVEAMLAGIARMLGGGDAASAPPPAP